MAHSENKSSVSDEDLPLILCMVLIVVLVTIYNYKFEWFSAIWHYIRLGEVYALQYMPDFLQRTTGLRFSKVLEFLKDTPAGDVHLETVDIINDKFFWWVRWISAPFIIFLGIQLLRWNSIGAGYITPNEYLKRIGSMEKFMSTTPYIDNDPADISIEYDHTKSPEENCWAVPLDYTDWLTCNPPLGLAKKADQRPIVLGLKFDDYHMDLARRSYSSQMGRKLTNLKALKPHEVEVFKRCYKALEAAGEKRLVKALMARHAYVRTFLMGLLLQAREYGVLPHLVFRYKLKRTDRLLYLALCCLNSEPYPEVAGLKCHFDFERAVGEKVTSPMVEGAVINTVLIVDHMKAGVTKNINSEDYDELAEKLV